MNDRNTILKIIRHPLIRQIMENKMATTSIVTKLIAEELRHENILEQEQQNSVNKLLEVIEKYQEVFDLINPELNDSIKNNAQKVLELADLFNQVNEAQTGVHDRQAKNYFQKKQWDKAAQEILLGIDKTLKNIQSSIGQVQKDPKKAEMLYNQLVTFVKFYQYGVSLKQFAAEKEDPERKKLLAALLEAKDIKTFLAIYKKLAGEENQEAFETTRSAIQSIIGLKKDIKDQNELYKEVEDVLKAWLKTKSYMEFEEDKMRIYAKIGNLAAGVELKPEKPQDGAFEAFLKKIRNKSMEEKYSLIYQAGNKFFMGAVLAKYPQNYKDAIMALAKGKASIQEAADPEQAKKGRSMILSFLSYYLLIDKKTADKIRKNKSQLDKNIKRILAGAKVFDEFNKPLADEFRKFAKRMQEREALIDQLLATKDITEFINIYRKLAGEEFKDELKITIDVIKSLAALKKKKPDLKPGDKNLENILRSNWMAKNGFMDLQDIADRIKAKIVELITGIESDEKEDKGRFEKLLLALNKAKNMKEKLEITRVRFPQEMAVDKITGLKDLDNFKDLFMAVLGRKGFLEEAKTPQIQGGTKETRQFLIGYLAYYKLSDEQSYEKIKADDEKFKKELQRVMKAADHTESFNKPLADALRKFVEELSKKPEKPSTPSEEPQKIEAPDEEYVKVYIKQFKDWKSKFMNVKTLKEQSDVFYLYEQSILKLTGLPSDDIVGEQIAAYTRTARNLKEQEEPQTVKKSAVKGESKDILTGAIVTQRHVKSIQQILIKYSDYLGKPGGFEEGKVTVGSRELFDKFGEADPKKILYKFVKLLSKDIDSMNGKIKELLKKIDKKPKPDKDKEELSEQKKKLSLKEKILLVEEIDEYVLKHGLDLLNALTQFVEEAEADKQKGGKEAEADQQKGGEEEKKSPEEAAAEVGPPPGKRDDLFEQEEKEGKEEKPDRTQRPDEEVYGSYKQIALNIHEQLQRVAYLFPTARPFDSKYSMQQVNNSFNSVIQKLDSVVANVQNFLRDEDINQEALKNLREQLTAIKKVMIRMFGLSPEQEEAENTAAINDEGANSGLPEPKDDLPPPEPEEEEEKYSDEITEEDKELLFAAYEEDREYYEKIKKRIRELGAGDSAVDFGQVPDVPLNEIMKQTEDLILQMENEKDMIKLREQDYEKASKSRSTAQIKKAKERLISSIRAYIRIYDSIGKAIQSRDYSKVLDDPRKRTGKVQKLIDQSLKYMKEKEAINKLFVMIITNKFENPEEKDLEKIWEALKDADGKEAERLTGQMKYKIDRAGQNIKNLIKNTFDTSGADYSGFKKFVSAVADRISGTAIKIDKKINEEEEDIEIEPTDQDKERAEKEKSSEREEAAEKELKKRYLEGVAKAIKEMTTFVSVYSSFNHALEQIENDVGFTKYLEHFDEDYASVKGLLTIMDDRLKKVARMFGQDISLTDARKYGFPPSDAVTEPENPASDEGEGDESSDIKKKFKLEKLQKETGMSDEQTDLYARLLDELQKDGIIKLAEAKPGQAFVNNVKRVMRKKFSKEERKEILKIFELDGILDHLQSVYVGDTAKVEDEDDPAPVEEKIAKKLKPLIREILNKGK